MAISADTTRIAIVAETTFGVTPATPAFRILPITSESLAGEPTTTLSNQLSASRAVPDSILTNFSTSGDLNFELMRDDALELLFAAAFGGTWANVTDSAINYTGATSADIDAAAGTITDAGADFVTAGFTASMLVTLSGFANAGNNRTVLLTRVTTNVLTFIPESGMVSETGAGATVDFATPAAHAQLKVGSTLQSFTIEKRFRIDDTPTYKYHRYTGCIVSGMGLTVTPGEPITGTFSLIGKDVASADAEIAGAAYAAAASNPVMTALRVTNINFTGAGAVPCFGSLNLNLNGNTRGLSCIGKFGFDEMVLGRLEAELSGQFYFGSDTLFDALRAQTDLALTFDMNDTAAVPNSYRVNLPRGRLNANAVVVPGTNQDVVEDLTIAAQHDNTENSNIVLDRVHGA